MPPNKGMEGDLNPPGKLSQQPKIPNKIEIRRQPSTGTTNRVVTYDIRRPRPRTARGTFRDSPQRSKEVP